MTDRAISFSAPMVRALIEGRKTQTRRVLKPQPDTTSDPSGMGRWGAVNRFGYWRPAEEARPCAPGDRLWVREAWRCERGQDRQNATEIAAACLDAGYSQVWCPTFYEADSRRVNFDNGMVAGRWRSPIHMPRWASRLTLTVTDVRVQRVREISEPDAMAEGADYAANNMGFSPISGQPHGVRTFKAGFAHLWSSIHGPDAWDANPWVAALTFTVEQRNIDA